MKMSKIFSVVSGAIMVAAVSGNVFAAEDAAGVVVHMKATLEKTQSAQAAAAAGNKDACLADIKAAKQHYKEVTGDKAGKPLQDAIKVLKVGQEQCEKGDTATAATTLADVVSQLQKLQ